MNEFTDGFTDSEVGNVVDYIKAAKASDNHVQGLISKNMDFRTSLNETFLFDTGATVSIIGLEVAKDNKLLVYKLEASGSRLDIVGSCELFVKLKVLGKIKQLTCLVLRGKNVDREILI